MENIEHVVLFLLKVRCTATAKFMRQIEIKRFVILFMIVHEFFLKVFILPQLDQILLSILPGLLLINLERILIKAIIEVVLHLVLVLHPGFLETRLIKLEKVNIVQFGLLLLLIIIRICFVIGDIIVGYGSLLACLSDLIQMLSRPDILNGSILICTLILLLVSSWLLALILLNQTSTCCPDHRQWLSEGLPT